jgi:ABC-type lipoprotein release transport system permease subunit
MIGMLAWRNIWRNPRQSLVLIAAISMGVLCSLFIVAFYSGMVVQRVDSVIKKELSHIQIHHPMFKDELDPAFQIAQSDSIADALSSLENVQAVAKRIRLQGMVSSPAGSSAIILNATNPEAEQNTTGLRNRMTNGSYLDTPMRQAVLISEHLLAKLKTAVHRKLVFTFQNSEGEVVSAAFKICGTFKSNSKPFDLMNVFIRLEDLRSLQGNKKDLNEIAILLKDRNDLEKIQNLIREKLPDYKVENWQELSPEMRLLVSTFQETMYIFMAIILLALSFGITNTMLMSVVQRTREFGMLLAFGMKKSRIFLMILLETFLIMLCGLPLGILMALGIIFYYGKKGINLEIYNKTMESFGYDTIIYPVITADHLINMLALISLLVLVSALGPARRALSLKPVEALRKI